MNAGSALGLLAGLGAINAMRGGKDGKRFTSLIDMIDGGGAGQSGDKFEGGGLLSMLGNLFAKPYEAQDNVERIAKEAAAVKTVAPKVTPIVTPQKTVVQTAAMEDAYPQQDYGYDYPTYAPKPTTTTPSSAPASDPYAYLFQGQGRPAPVEKYIPTGGTTAATGMTYGQSNQPTFQQFLAMQKQMEAQMGLQPMNEQEYLNMYQTQIQRMGM